MGVRFPSVQSNAIVNATLVTTAETVVCTTPALTLPLDSAVVLLMWVVNGTAGAGTTSWSYRIRRGTTAAGTVVNVASNFTTAAGNLVQLSGAYFDTPGAAAGQQYSLTVQQVAAAGNGSIQDACLIAFAL